MSVGARSLSKEALFKGNLKRLGKGCLVEREGRGLLGESIKAGKHEQVRCVWETTRTSLCWRVSGCKRLAEISEGLWKPHYGVWPDGC